MYEMFFHLDKRPFSATPDCNCCYLTDSSRTVLEKLTQCIEMGQGIGILTGPAGIGKTLLCRKLVSDLGNRFIPAAVSSETYALSTTASKPLILGLAKYKIAFISTGDLPSRRALLQAILYELGQPYGGKDEQELRLELASAVKSLVPESEGMLLVLDEAHLLGERLLEEVRLISDFSQDGRPLVRVLMSGQLELEENLTGAALSAFNQRISEQVSLEPLTRAESEDYVAYRLALAGRVASEVFAPEALELLSQVCDGIPRCINQLCDHSLLLAFMSDNPFVDEATVREALTDLKQLPLHWNSVEVMTETSDTTDDASREQERPGAGQDLGSLEIHLGGIDSDSLDGTSEQFEQFLAEASFEIGAELEAETDCGSKDPQSWQVCELPAEELVFDRYAALDAGRDPNQDFEASSEQIMPARPIRNTDSNFPERRGEIAANSDAVPESSRPVPFDSPLQIDSNRPDQLIDALLSILDDQQTSNDWEEGAAALLSTESSDGRRHTTGGPSVTHETQDNPGIAHTDSQIERNPQRVSPAPAPAGDGQPVWFSAMDVDPQPHIVSPDPLLESIEEQIGSMVLDVCFDTEQIIVHRLETTPEPIESVDTLFPSLEVEEHLEGARTTRFDVVEPELPGEARNR